jgi:hypothetical protein
MPVIKLNTQLKISFFFKLCKCVKTSVNEKYSISGCARKEGVWRKWRYSSTDVNLGTRWRNVVSFISVTIYLRRKRHWSWVRTNGGFDA